MKCNITTCSRHEDCGILDIIRKMPKSPCSYFKSQAKADKEEKKEQKQLFNADSKKVYKKK